MDCIDCYNDVKTQFISTCLLFYTQCWSPPRANFLVIVGGLAAVRPTYCLIPIQQESFSPIISQHQRKALCWLAHSWSKPSDHNNWIASGLDQPGLTAGTEGRLGPTPTTWLPPMMLTSVQGWRDWVAQIYRWKSPDPSSCETENVLLEMLNKGQVISSLYALKYIFGKITFCKKNKKIEIVKEIDDLKARTYSQRPGEN